MSNGSGGGLLTGLGGLLIVAAIGVFGYWYASGAAMVTQYEVATTVTEEDEFGDAIERTVMTPQFRFGLLPDRGYDSASTVGGGLGALGVILLVVGRRSRRS